MEVEIFNEVGEVEVGRGGSTKICFKFALQILHCHCLMIFDSISLRVCFSLLTDLSFSPSLLQFPLSFLTSTLFDTSFLTNFFSSSFQLFSPCYFLSFFSLSSLQHFFLFSCPTSFCLDSGFYFSFSNLFSLLKLIPFSCPVAQTFLVLSHLSTYLMISLSLHQQNDHFSFSLFLQK